MDADDSNAVVSPQAQAEIEDYIRSELGGRHPNEVEPEEMERIIYGAAMEVGTRSYLRLLRERQGRLPI